MLRKFRNYSEDQIQRQIRTIIDRHGAELHEKVRIADLIDIDMLDRRELGTYALQAHFDFVLVDERQEAVVAIEFDGLGHDQTNDHKKNSICRQANLPLFRIFGFEQIRKINAITFIKYLVELVFHARIFLNMQNDGSIPPDEPFILSGFLKPNAKNIFDSEFDFIANANGKLTHALKKGELAVDQLPHLTISRLTLRAPDGGLRAFMSIDTLKGPVVGTASLRVEWASPGFLGEVGSIKAEIAQFAEGMAAESLLENIEFITNGHGHVVTNAEELLEEIKTLRSLGYTGVMASGSGSAEVDLMAEFEIGIGHQTSAGTKE